MVKYNLYCSSYTCIFVISVPVVAAEGLQLPLQQSYYYQIISFFNVQVLSNSFLFTSTYTILQHNKSDFKSSDPGVITIERIF